ncbi:hypothetical protein GF407_00340 [candidate division KSB1 bacterium]|nr:hypothetical protein [candidate division KSB1 bacterium]
MSGTYKMVLVSLLTLFVGCREITTTTHIHPDGSCQRIVSVKSGNKTPDTQAFYIPSDSTWQIKQTRKKKSGDWIYTAQKSFDHIKYMQAEYITQPDSIDHIRVSMQFEKRFRWFSTTFFYQETYHAYNPFGHIPLQNRLTPQEIELFYAGADSGDIDEKFETWQTDDAFEDFFIAFIDSAAALNDPRLRRDVILQHKEQIRVIINELGDDVDHSVEKMLDELQQLFATDSVYHLKGLIRRKVGEIETKSDFILTAQLAKYTQQVSMPGVITDTNAPVLKGNVVSWSFDGSRFYERDMKMWVKARKTNPAMIILTLAIAALCLIIIAAGGFYRYKRGKTEQESAA